MGGAARATAAAPACAGARRSRTARTPSSVASGSATTGGERAQVFLTVCGLAAETGEQQSVAVGFCGTVGVSSACVHGHSSGPFLADEAFLPTGPLQLMGGGR